MRTILNILNFILGGFATTLGWLLATLVSIMLIVTLPLTRSCWEITRLSLFPYGNEAIHVDELEPGRQNSLLNAGGTILNILWFIFFGWWLCLMHIFSGIAQCLTIIGIPVGSLILKSPPSPSGRWVAGSSLWKPRAPHAKPMRVVAFSNRTEHGHD
ncbi:inner membrane protein YccF [Klebsiella quasipneumoniae]|nr:inner membrane protein YccF [Klebsiella quasipneumoniae]